MPQVIAPFATVNAALSRRAALPRITTEEFERGVDILLARSGWNVAEFFAVRRGNVIEITAETH